MPPKLKWKKLLPEVERLASLGIPENKLAQCLGIHRHTFREYKQREPEFNAAFERGRASLYEKLTTAAEKQVANGNTAMQIFMMKSMMGLRENDPAGATPADETLADIKELIGRLPD